MPDEATIKRWITKWGLFVLVAILGGEAKDRMEYKTMFMTRNNA